MQFSSGKRLDSRTRYDIRAPEVKLDPLSEYDAIETSIQRGFGPRAFVAEPSTASYLRTTTLDAWIATVRRYDVCESIDCEDTDLPQRSQGLG